MKCIVVIFYGMYKRGKLVKNNYELKTLRLIKKLREKNHIVITEYQII